MGEMWMCGSLYAIATTITLGINWVTVNLAFSDASKIEFPELPTFDSDSKYKFQIFSDITC